MPALALTDHGNLYGAVGFYQKAKKAGIKPILGVEAYVITNNMREKRPGADNKRYHLILLASDNEGWKNLIKLVTLAHLEGFYYKPRLDKETIRKHARGLIALSGCLSGEISQAILARNQSHAEKLVEEYKQIFGKDNFFIELSHHPGIPEHKKVQESLLKLAQKTGTPVVATQDVHYLKSEDSPYQDILLAVQTNSRLDDPDRLTMNKDDFSLRPLNVMQEFFRDIPEALENTVRIAERIKVDLPIGKIQLPHFALPENETPQTYLGKISNEAVKEKYSNEMLQNAYTRLDFELEAVTKTGFSSYFLIVRDIVRWARKNGIIVGPGRGSAAGSIISYVLGITSVDPLKYNLLFERFMNPDRIDWPDIDLDFADSRRDEVIDYITERYGRNHVAQIITFGTMAARAAVRDAGRALNLSYQLCDEVAKMIPFGFSLKKALETVPELREANEQRDEIRKLLEAARHLEGVARHASTHACGVVITKDLLTAITPLQYATTGSEDRKQSIVTQFDMHSVNALGLLKMDILGLSNLTIIEETINRIKERSGKDIDINKIPLDDPKPYSMLAEGRTVGVFQLEGSGMTRYLKELKPTHIEDIVAMISLYRPGPMELIPSFIRRKHKKEHISFPHQLLEPYLKNTHGIMIYQEQVMQMSEAVAGFTPGEADTLRKAIGKKNKKLLDEQQEKFIKGVADKTGSKKLGTQLWELILPFARYGFPRSHAVSYAIVAYQTAWLKCHYPIEFMVSLLNADSKSVDRIAFLVAECKKENIAVSPPDVNESDAIFTVTGNKKIRFGLGSIKNVGHNIVSTIMEERGKNGKYTSLTDFLERIYTRDLNKKSLEALIKSGAVDVFGERNQMLENIDMLLAYLKENQTMNEHNQTSLFGLIEDSTSIPILKLKEATPASNHQRLKWERELLGLYISGHPLQQFKKTGMLKQNIHVIKHERGGSAVRIAALLSEVRRILTKHGEPMAFLKLEDMNDNIEGVAFPSAIKQYGHLIEQNKCVLIEGKVNIRNGAYNVICDKIEPLT